MKPSIKLAIVDDEHLFLVGLQAIIEEYEAAEVVLTASDGSQFLERLEAAEVQPDVVLLDMKMAPMNGIETAQHLREHYPELKVMILSTHYRDSYLGYMMKLGVSAFLPKNINPKTLVGAIQKVHEVGLYFTEEHALNISKQLASGQKFSAPHLQPTEELTPRESEILKLICEQYTSSEIATKLFVSIRTVEGHRNNLLAKTGAKNTVGLVLYALVNNIVDVNQHLVQFTVS